MAENEEKAVIESKWGKSLGIDELVIQEVKIFSDLGWAKDGNGNSRPLNLPEQKMLCVMAHKLELSPVGGQIFYLGNKVYIAVNGKVAKASRDTIKPYIGSVKRPATEEERLAAGLTNNDPDKPKLYEHYWHVTIQALIGGNIVDIGNEFGHACVGNIKLKGKENDPVRLCSDMAKTRGLSRALTSCYDFFGADSYEEIALVPGDVKTVLETEAKVTTVDSSDEGGLSYKDILDYMESNRDHLPSESFQTYSEERLAGYTSEALKETFETLESHVKKAKESEQQPELGIPETDKSEKEEKPKTKSKKTK